MWDGRADWYLASFLRGEITYMEFSRLDAAEWRGISRSRILKTLDEIEYVPCARELLAALKRAGAVTALISSGLLLLAERVGRELGLDYVYANELVSAGDLMTGDVRINVSIDDPSLTKGAILESLATRLDIPRERVAAIGDNWGDADLFRAAGIAIMVNPAPECEVRVRKHAPHVRPVSSLCDAFGVLGLSAPRSS